MPSDYISPALRAIIAARAQNRCEYCKCSADFATETFAVEHIQPRSLGGDSSLENLAWSCMGCNSYKGSKINAADPETEEMTVLFHPRSQDWSQHFAWSDDGCEVMGKTSTGRATIQTLRLNRIGVTNLRRVLVQAGLHPPS